MNSLYQKCVRFLIEQAYYVIIEQVYYAIIKIKNKKEFVKLFSYEMKKPLFQKMKHLFSCKMRKYKHK